MDRKANVAVTDFLDAHLYLSAVYRARKEREPRFSYEAWAQELGLTSKSYLRFATLGKRKISPALTQRLCENLALSEAEREYFTLLVLYTQCTEPQQKRILSQKLTAALRRPLPYVRLEPDQEVLGDPLLVIFRNYLSFPDALRTPAAIGRIFGLGEDAARECLAKLAAAGLVECENGEWRARHQWIKVESHPGHQVLANYHNRSLLKAIAAQALDAGTRTFRSLSFALQPSEYENLVRELAEFAEQVCAKYDPENLEERRIYQMNFNLIPWTAPNVGSS